ncbi:hypothetical protein [Lacticaseibacillus absianus]|uniref:hypothetical protein n=1 Tax=Lacticaseibacillus absianus TaxID=2729623 RepID=UPI0015C84168|nr:hypothetical protein [Lacticaseibacillus absianus]
MRKLWVLALAVLAATLLAGCASRACHSRKQALAVASRRLQARYGQAFTLVRVTHYRHGALQATFAPRATPTQPTRVTLTAQGTFTDDYRKYQVLPALRRELATRLGATAQATSLACDLVGETHLKLPATIGLDDYLDNVDPLPVITVHPAANRTAAQLQPVYDALCRRFPAFRLRVIRAHQRRVTVTQALHQRWLTPRELQAQLD